MNSNAQCTAPVLLITFNRPDTTKVVFGKIRDAKPLKLYVAVDGPRKDKKADKELVTEVRRIVQEVDWPCDVNYKFNEENAGAEITVSSAISWVLEKEEYVIILEDDIIAPLSFFRFTEEMLIRYKDEPIVSTVSGSNFTPITVPNEADYFFAKYGHSWGWGTWRRAWKNYDLNIKIPDKHFKKTFLTEVCNSRAEINYYHKIFKNMQQKGPGNSTWDYVGLYRHRVNNLLSVIPRVNLTSNIGVHGLHARGKTEHHFRPVDKDFIVNKHPGKVECYTVYDKHHFKNYINKKRPLLARFVRKAMRLLG